MENIVDTIYAVNDYSQSRYLMRVGEVMSHKFNSKKQNKKLIIISDQFIKIQQEIYIDKQSPQIRQIVDNLVYFIKLSVQQGKKMNIFKESIKSSMNLSNEQDEIFQLRNDSMLCEQVEQKRYVCKRKNKIIRKLQFPDLFYGVSIGELKKQSIICLARRHYKNLNVIYYCLETGRSTKVELSPNFFFYNSSLSISKDNQYIFIGNNLCYSNNLQVIQQIHSRFTSFSPCSTYFAYTETSFSIKIINLQKGQVFCNLFLPYLLPSFGEQKYFQIDFKENKILVEDWNNQLITYYSFPVGSKLNEI